MKGFGNIMKEAQKLQAQMEALQAEVGKKKVEATAGGGMVTVEANGKQEIVSIKIDREVINPDDAQMLEDLVLAACNEALRKSREMVQQRDGQADRRASRSPASGCRMRVAYYPEPVARLIEALQRLPGIGPKTAQRLTFFLLKRPVDEVRELADVAHGSSRSASCTARRASTSPRRIPAASARDPARDARSLCVVEEPNDLLALERTGEFRGRYHVLLGALSPLDGIGPEDLKVRELLAPPRGRRRVDEVILATNPNVEGEATAIYLAKLLTPARPARHAHRARPAGGRRSRVRRRGDADQGPGGPEGDGVARVMYTQVIQSVFFWAGLLAVGSWLAIELLNAWDHYRLHTAARARLGLDEQPAQSAWEERMRLQAAVAGEDPDGGRSL